MVQTRAQRHQKRNSRGGKKKKRFNFRMFLGFLLILVAVGLFAMNPIKDWMIAHGSEQNTVGNFTREMIEANNKKEVTYNFDDIQNIDALSVISDGINPNDLPVVGGIAIPDVGMNLPIYKGVSNEGMYYGAGTLSPDQQMGKSNYSLASHHSIHKNLLFAPLLRVQQGQKIYLTDLDKVYVYEIDSIQQVPATAIEVLDPTEDPTITLITCDSDLVDRIVVKGSLVKTVPIDEASDDMIKALELPQTTAA